MSKIKDNQKDYIDREVRERMKTALEQKHTSVSLEHELSNKNFHPMGIRDKNNRLLFHEELLRKLKDVNSCTWKDYGKRDRRTGYESIPFSQFQKGLKSSFKQTNIVTPDSKLDVIRVTDDYRMIGKYLNGVYHILAFDLDFSAYKH